MMLLLKTLLLVLAALLLYVAMHANHAHLEWTASPEVRANFRPHELAIRKMAIGLCGADESATIGTAVCQHTRELWYSSCTEEETGATSFVMRACAYADERWFGMKRLRDALFADFDAIVSPRIHALQSEIEQNMREAAVHAYQTHFHDMNIVDREVSKEQQAGLGRVMKVLDNSIETLLHNHNNAPTIILASKHNAFWMPRRESIAPETWAFVFKVLNARSFEWLVLKQEESEQLRERLRSFPVIHLEMSTNPRFKRPGMPQRTELEKWSQYANEMLLILGSVKILSFFA